MSSGRLRILEDVPLAPTFDRPEQRNEIAPAEVTVYRSCPSRIPATRCDPSNRPGRQRVFLPDEEEGTCV